MSKGSTNVHQAVHGYNDGHRLLVGSVSLETPVRRQMDVLSDLPDVYALTDGRPIFTAYPLAGSPFYVFAMTWPAPELQRPGCVWTHSLLLDREAQSLEEPLGLLSLFRRPTVESLPEYRHALEFGLQSYGREPLPPDTAETIIWSLYGPPVQAVEMRRGVLGTVSPGTVLVGLWAQQWPALRAASSVAHAPDTARRLGRDLFDFQVTERPSSSSWRQSTAAPAIRSVVQTISEPKPRWVQSLAEDLGRPGAARVFLWDFGPDTPSTPKSVWGLAYIRQLLLGPSSPSQVSEVFRVVDEAFPALEDAGRLKSALLGGPESELLPQSIDATSLLIVALKGGRIPSFVENQYLLSRASELAKANPEALFAALGAEESDASPAAHAVAEGFAAGIGMPSIDRWMMDDPVSFRRFALRRSELLYRSPIWRDERGRRVWECLHGLRGSEGREKILEPLIASGNVKIIRAALAEWPEADDHLLAAIETDKASDPVRAVLSDVEDSSVEHWLERHDEAPTVVSGLLDFAKSTVLASIPAWHLERLGEAYDRLSDFQLGRLFGVSSGKKSLGPKMATEVFLELQKRSKLSKATRKDLGDRLNEEVPSDPESQVRLLIESFVANRWSSKPLFDLDQAMFKRILRADDTGRLILSMGRELDRGSVKANKAQQRLLWDALTGLEGKPRIQFHELVRKHVPWA